MPALTDLGVDLDGVVYPFVLEFADYCRTRLGLVNLPIPMTYRFHESWGMTAPEFAAALDDGARSCDLFGRADPEPGTREAWQRLRAAGVRLHVLTARPASAWARTCEWLAAHGLVADSLTFTADKRVAVAHARGPMAMLEDDPSAHAALLTVGVRAVFVDRPWNGGYRGERVVSFAEFAEAVLGS